MSSLSSYATEHGHGKYDWYFPFYDDALRDVDVKRLLEIGCSERSITTWLTCFPDAWVIGLDITHRGPTNQDDLRELEASVRGFTFVEGDQMDEDLLASLGSFDVIVDDGGHHSPQQISSFISLFRNMNSGGWYFIEDLHCSYDPQYQVSGATTMEWLKTLLDDLHARYAGDADAQYWPISEIRFCDSLVGIRRA